MSAAAPCVGVLVTCLVDLMRPSVGFATVKLLRDAGCRVAVPKAQTCCGQPAYNSGARRDARAIARNVIEAFDGYDAVIVPSGSCAGMIKRHYPDLFVGDDDMSVRARTLADRTHELTSYLHDVRGFSGIDVECEGIAAYHDSCSSLRDVNVKDQPRALLRRVRGLELRDLADPEACCGFGGLFCVKYPDVSERMLDQKVEDVLATGADMVLAGDLGCLMNLAGRLSRRGERVAVRHVAEVLAGLTDVPPIGLGRRWR